MSLEKGLLQNSLQRYKTLRMGKKRGSPRTSIRIEKNSSQHGTNVVPVLPANQPQQNGANN